MLDGPRARGAFLIRSVLNPPFCLRIEDGAPLCLVTMIRGEAWMIPDNEQATLLRPGDIAIVRGPRPYTVADVPSSPVSAVIQPGQQCLAAPGQDSESYVDLGERSWGESGQASTIMLSGTYRMDSEVGQRLLGTLPPVLVRPAGSEQNPLVSWLTREMDKTDPEQEIVLDRLLDLLLITVVREWLADPQAGAPAWHRATHDYIVGPALRVLHAYPAHDWTIAKLASQIAVSRAALARRFTALVGEPPMMYLTRLRLDMAAELLCQPGNTIQAVARQVGYGSSFALSTAFKRVRGISPQEHRRAVLKSAGQGQSSSAQTVRAALAVAT
jgi:AraC-like DNA-binding protein